MRLTIFYCLFSVLLVSATVDSVDPFYYPHYHLAPPSGWMNDPNGFCHFNGHYHLFYQYNPYSSQEPGIAHWGHAISKDLFHWEHLPIAMAPDKSYDRSGVFSGSALIENNTMYLFYTGNVNHEGQTPDHEQHQALAWSHDGVTVTKYEGNPIIVGANRQPNFRDPKVWKHGDTYYMVLGNSYNNDTLGQALLYSSKDLYDWKEIAILDKSYGWLGYMWECPDFFELDGLFVFLWSPQGMERQGIRFSNLYQTGYLIGEFDYKTYKFNIISEFRELDFGHDLYASQTIKDLNGDRIMIAWEDMWENVYPERDAGFTGHMTIPRILTLDQNLRLLQKPVTQIHNAVGKMLYSGEARSDAVVTLVNNTGRIEISAPGCEDFILILESDGKAVVTISYFYDMGLITFDRGGVDGKRSTKWRPKGQLRWTVFVDRSSIELFAGHGEVTFTSRIYPSGYMCMRIGETCHVYDMTVHSMEKTMP